MNQMACVDSLTLSQYSSVASPKIGMLIISVVVALVTAFVAAQMQTWTPVANCVCI